MAERIAPANGIEIAYETFGDSDDPTLLLIMGLGVQMLGWDEELCRMLAERGFRVVRFDNRDVGRSTQVVGGPRADVMAAAAGDLRSASYRLDEMAEDCVGLLDHLGAGTAHVVGASQGGMIAQALAIRHPERVLSLTSIMSTTGDRAVGQPHPEAIPALLTRPPADREGFAEFAVGAWRVIGSPGFEPDEEALRARATASFDRGIHPEGTARQLVAILASGDRTAELQKLDLATLVIHGTADVLIDASGGKATAAAIPGARLELIEGMGHDLPRALWPRFVDLIADNAARAHTLDSIT
ncbi:MAG TPA: alpha/beta fold hydrolase [Solirubrobacterales bacterium]|nr:alpha/beta fold hydrolase [Solirubrobacterales bacterium]